MKLIKRVSYLEEMSSLLHTPDIKVVSGYCPAPSVCSF